VKAKHGKVLEILIFVSIILLSIIIFFNREKIENVSNISYLGLMGLCFLANATVLLPAPSLVIASSCALILNPWLVAIFAAMGSSLGELVGYVFGAVSKEISPKLQALLDRVLSKIKNQTLLVFILALVPLPLFDVVGIYSGGIKMNLVKFFIACYIGKLIKLIIYINCFDMIVNYIQ
jgi:membrane protein YqaA with SNARE-associated domain